MNDGKKLRVGRKQGRREQGGCERNEAAREGPAPESVGEPSDEAPRR